MYEVLEEDIERQKDSFDADYDPFKITFLYNYKNILYGFIAKGDTGFSQYGLDIIAAGVSVLIINAINSIQQISVEIIEAKAEKNLSSCILPKVQQRSRGCIKAMVLLHSLKIGMQTIQHTYGDKYIIIEDIKEHNRNGIIRFFKR